MDPRHLRSVVSSIALAATAGAAIVIGHDPLPNKVPAVAPIADERGAQPTLTEREARALARLDAAERRLLAAAATAESADPAPSAPVVSVAPTSVPPVTQSGSS